MIDPALEVVLVLSAGAAGSALFRVLSVPIWTISGAIFGAGGMHLLLGSSTPLPDWVAPIAQILVGAAIGSTIGPSVFRELKRFAVPGLFVVIAILAGGLGLGLALSEWTELGDREAVLGMVPGGVPEMVAAAISLRADAAVISAMHLVRLLLVVWTLPIVLWLARRAEPPHRAEARGTGE